MFALLSQWFALARTAMERRRAIESLSRLSDAQLRDVGLERGTMEDRIRVGLPWPMPENSARPRALRPSVQGCG